MDGRPSDVTPLESTLVYTQFLGKSLRERVEAFHRKQTDLREETAMMQALACEAANQYDAIVEATKTLDASKRVPLVAAANAILVQALNQVRDMRVAAHRLTQNKDTYSPEQVQHLIFQTAKVIDVKFASRADELKSIGIDPAEWAREIAVTVDERIGAGVLDGAGAPGMTALDPADEEARAMDATVPFREDVA